MHDSMFYIIRKTYVVDKKVVAIYIIVYCLSAALSSATVERAIRKRVRKASDS